MTVTSLTRASARAWPRRAAAITSICTALLLAGAAFAQGAEEGTGKSATLEEVVVTAQFRKQNLQETPIAITAVTAQMLESRSQTSVLDVANQAPNVTLKRGVSGFGPSLQAYIRGVGQNDFNFAFEPGVGMYVDDVYYSTLTGSIFDLLDLDRVEVLRGPQGTLAGMNSLGGAIKLYTKKPDGTGGGYIEGTYGAYNRTDFRGGADFAIVPDVLFARVAGVSRHEDGYVTRYDYACTHPQLAATYNIPSFKNGSGCKLGTEGGVAYDAVRASLRFTPTDKLEMNFTADSTHDRSEAAPQTLLFVGTVTNPVSGGVVTTPGLTTAQQASYPRFTSAAVNGLPLANSAGVSPYIAYSPFGQEYAGDTFSRSPYINYSTYGDVKPIDGTPAWSAEPVSQVNGYGFSASVDYKLTDALNFTSITSYRYYDADWAQDYEATQLSNAVLTYDVWHWQWSQEFRLAGRLFDDRVSWVTGVFYFKQKSHYGGRVDQGSAEFVENDFIPAKNQAVFANAAWTLTDRLELNAGIRYSTEEKTFKFGREGVPGTPAGGAYQPCALAGGMVMHVAFCSLNGAEGHFDGNNVDYRAVLQYKWTPDLMTYGSVATGFKGGGVNPRPFYPDQANPFDPETLTAFEIGVKSSWLEQTLQANLSMFENRYQAIQRSIGTGCVLQPGQTNCSQYLNTGDGKLRGVELEVMARPLDALAIDASISYLDFEYTYISDLAFNAGVRSDMNTPYAPTWKYSLGAQYEFATAGGSITPRFDASYQSALNTSAVNNYANRVPGYTLVNGRLTWQQTEGLWQVSLEGTNLTDKLYYSGYLANSSSYTIVGSPAPPREWALTVKRTF